MTDSLFVLWSYYRAKRRHFFNRESLEVWQRKKLDRALRQAVRKFPFYKNMAGIPYESLPITDKKILVSRFEEMNSLGISLQSAMNLAVKSEISRDFSPMIGNTSVGLSTGTSGSRSVFLVQRHERLKWAGTVLARALPGTIWSKHRIAFLFRANNNLYETVRSNRINFQFFDLLQPLDVVTESLAKFSPSILIGPSHALGQIAIAKASGMTKVSPMHVISVAEVLEDRDKQLIETAFGTKVQQIYQATEGFLASTCAFGTLHLNEDLLYFERQYLDFEKRRFVPIITDFYRESQAIIRYRLNDVLIIKDNPCPCGSALLPIEKIEGRCDDIIFLRAKEGNELKPVFPDILRNALAKSNLGFEEFQIVQTQINQLLVRIDPIDGQLDETLLVTSLLRLFESLKVCPPEVKVELGTKFDISKKFRRIERRFAISEAQI